MSSDTISKWHPGLVDRATLASNWRLAISSVAVAGAYLALSWHTTGPAYLEDEIGYLANAAFLSGHRIDAASSYHAGYSLFIAPAFLLSGPSMVWKGVLTINAILWGASFAMLYALLRRLLPRLNPSYLLATTVISALYPTWVVSSGYAFATTAFVAVFLASLLALFLWSRANPFSILPHAALVGYLYWVHPTGAAVALASVLAVAVNAWRWRDARPLLLHASLIAGLVAAYQWGVHPWLAASMTPPGYTPHSHYPSLAAALQTLLTGHGFAVFATLVAGQTAYFIVASFGMAFVGLLYCARRILDADGDAAAAKTRPVWLLIGIAPIGIVGLGAISFFQWDRFEGDFWVYGRYLEGAILPVLAIGLAVFRADIRLAALSIFLLSTGLLLFVTVPAADGRNIVNTVAFWPQYLSANGGFLVWMLFGTIAIAGVAQFGRRLVIGLMAAAVLVSVYRQTVWHNWILTDFSAPSSLVETIRSNYPKGTCVGVDPILPQGATLYQAERYHLNAFYLFDYAYRRMSPSQWLAQCDGPYLTYSATDLNKVDGVRQVAADKQSGLLLIEKTGMAENRSASSR